MARPRPMILKKRRPETSSTLWAEHEKMFSSDLSKTVPNRKLNTPPLRSNTPETAATWLRGLKNEVYSWLYMATRLRSRVATILEVALKWRGRYIHGYVAT